MNDFKTVMNNFLFQIENTIDTLRKTLLRCLATFLIWFSVASGIGMGILVSLKLLKMCFF